jgi:predicted nucleotidyltransferase
MSSLSTPLTDTSLKPAPSPHLDGFLAALRQKLPTLRQIYGVQALWLFGSYVRGEETSKSDLDILVELDTRPLSLLKFIELENQLSDLLGEKVDLVDKKALKPAISQYILREIVAV